MKLEIEEVFFLKNAAESVTVKGKDAKVVSSSIVKLDKEFERLQKLSAKKAALPPGLAAAK